MNVDNFKALLDSISDSYKSRDLLSEPHSNEWFQFDINYSPNDIKIGVLPTTILQCHFLLLSTMDLKIGFQKMLILFKNIFTIQTDSLNHQLAFKS